MRAARILAAATALALLAALPAPAAINRDGDLVVSFEGGFDPTSLPRGAPAPVRVEVAGRFRTASGDPGQLPQLRRITVAINRQGRLFDRGLPTCDPRSVDPSTKASAREVCGDAIIGGGHVDVQIRLLSQLPFEIRASLLVFNGPWRNGHKLIYAEAYASDPPGVFLITFKLQRRPGTFGTVLSTTLPASSRDWAYLTGFKMHLHRLYEHRGQRRSLVSASCGAPPGFSTAIFPFARATYSFANGQRLTLSEAATCRVGAG